jgi:hypothetical protein
MAASLIIVARIGFKRRSGYGCHIVAGQRSECVVGHSGGFGGKADDLAWEGS